TIRSLPYFGRPLGSQRKRSASQRSVLEDPSKGLGQRHSRSAKTGRILGTKRTNKSYRGECSPEASEFSQMVEFSPSARLCHHELASSRPLRPWAHFKGSKNRKDCRSLLQVQAWTRITD